MDNTKDASSWLARIGMIGALGLSFITIVGAVGLCVYLLVTFSHGEVNPLVLRLLLSAIACFIAVSFGILGFALFLIQAEGTFKGNVAREGKSALGLETTAPGLIVFLCATVILWLALKMNITLHTDDDPAAKDPPAKDPAAEIDAGVDAALDAVVDAGAPD